MKYGFISNSLHSLSIFLNYLPTANSTQELALFVSDNATSKNLENHQKQPQSNISKIKDFANKHTKTLAAALAITGAMATTQITAQNSATIDPIHYKTAASPFVIPNLASGSDYYLSIKGGEKIFITIDGIDQGTGTYFIGSGIGQRINGDIIEIPTGYVGNRIVNYKRNGVDQTLGLQTHYQSNIYLPDGTTPETAWIGAGQQIKVSAGPNMNPTGSTTSGYYKWKAGNDVAYTGGYTDSTRVVGKGIHIARTNDGTGTWTNDTIAILEKPAIDGKGKNINFPSTTSGVLYKVFKLGAVLNQDTTWTEIPNLAFTGDGNVKTVQVPDLGLYRIGTQRTPSTPVEMNLPTQNVDFSNDVIDISGEEPTSFKQLDRVLFRDTAVVALLYSIDGRQIGSYLSNHITLSYGPGIYILKYIENRKVLTQKIILSP